MNNRKPRFKRSPVRILTLIIVQVLFLSFLAVSYYAVEWFGQEIRLQTSPVDPRDLFYGDYVILNYEISSVPEILWKGPDGEEPVRNQTVYVVLQPKDGLYVASAVYPEKPDKSSNEVAIKGYIEDTWDHTIRIRYGLERYYVPEGTGMELERHVGTMVVAVKVAPWGQNRIMRLELDNE